MQLSDISIQAWIQENGLKTETGKPLDLRDHLFLYDIFCDESPRIVGMKAAQIGWSTLATLKSFFTIKKYGIDAIYTLPTDSDVGDFVGGKVNRLIVQNPILEEYTADRDTVEQKQIGANMLYFRGTWTKKAAMMVPADLLIHDEYDASKQEVLGDYESRLQHSSYKWQWVFSHPSVAGYGVSRFWEKSDQKKWHILCAGCQKSQVLTWPDSIDVQKLAYVCKFCQKELTNEERRVGRWVAENPGAEWSGYWINLMMCPWVSAKEIVKYSVEKSAQYFYNRVLGLPYVGESNTVTPDVIFRNCTERINSQERVVIGCDSGLKKHYVLGNKEGLFFHGVTETWDDIRSLLKRYEHSAAVIDAMPDLTAPRMLREEFPGRVFLCHYARDRKTMQIIRWGEGDEFGNVVVDRNRGLQMVIDEFADRRIALQGTVDDWSPYYAHWKTLYKVVEEDALGIPQFKWETTDGNDHWAHASLYWRVGMDRFGHAGAKMFGGKENFIGSVKESPMMMPDETIRGVDTRKFIKAEEDFYDWRNV